MRILPPQGMEAHGDHAGEILECDPPRKLVYTWNMKDAPELARKRSGPLPRHLRTTPMGKQVRLRLIHENPAPGGYREGSQHVQRHQQRLAGRPQQPEEPAGNGRTHRLRSLSSARGF
jgi:uncharacterized protein YndB with AHSA1/START domain